MTVTYDNLTEDQIIWLYTNLGIKPVSLDIIMTDFNTSNDSSLPAFKYKVVPANYNSSCNLY